MSRHGEIETPEKLVGSFVCKQSDEFGNVFNKTKDKQKTWGRRSLLQFQIQTKHKFGYSQFPSSFPNTSNF